MYKLFITIMVFCAVYFCGCFFSDDKECDAGDMRCHNGISQMCSADEKWEDWQNCTSLSQTCYMSAEKCSGYVGISCCR